MPRSTPSTRSTFTLIELLVVVSIIAVLASLLLPALSRARAIAKRGLCSSNQKQIAMGQNFYADENDDWFMRSTYTTQAILGQDSTEDVAAEFFGGTDVLLCPDVKFMGPANSSYKPPKRYWSSFKFRITTYRHIASWAPTTAGWKFYGMHINGISATRNENKIAPMIPNRRFVDSAKTDPISNQTVYMHPAEMQPMIIDGFRLNATTWTTYASGHESENAHPGSNGMNVTFVDGHNEWKYMSGPRRTHNQGAGGWLHW